MTGLGTLTALIAAGAVTVGSLLGSDSAEPPGSGTRTALVIDASSGRAGRDLVNPRLRGVDAAIRLPRTSAEAVTNVRYFAKQGYRVVVVGPRASAAAGAAGVAAVHVPDLAGALGAAGR